MKIKTGCVYDEAAPDKDGLRVLITRYWPRGISKGMADMWIRGLGPSPGLIKEWKSGKLPWEDFKKRYLGEFSSEEKKAALAELKGALKGHARTTLLCACKEASRCHRSIVEEMLRG